MRPSLDVIAEELNELDELDELDVPVSSANAGRATEKARAPARVEATNLFIEIWGKEVDGLYRRRRSHAQFLSDVLTGLNG